MDFSEVIEACDSVDRNKLKEFLLFEERINLNKQLTGFEMWK